MVLSMVDTGLRRVVPYASSAHAASAASNGRSIIVIVAAAWRLNRSTFSRQEMVL